MTGNSIYIGTSLSGYIQEVVLNEKTIVSSKQICLKDNNKSAHWVGHSKLKTLYIEDFLKKISLMTYKLV